MSEQPLWQWSACQMAEAIADRQISATEVVASTVERMRRRNQQINAVTADLGNEALDEAANLDAIMDRTGPVEPLHGVPATIKENIDQKGLPTPNGVPAFSALTAPDDSTVMQNLRRAGAIIIGRPNTSEFSFRATTDNNLHGRTFNPWND